MSASIGRTRRLRWLQTTGCGCLQARIWTRRLSSSSKQLQNDRGGNDADGREKSSKTENSSEGETPRLGHCILVSGLPYNLKRNELRDHYTMFGRVTRAVVLRTERGSSSGKGLLCFEDPEDAFTAKTITNNAVLRGSRIRVRPMKDWKGEVDKSLESFDDELQLDFFVGMFDEKDFDQKALAKIFEDNEAPVDYITKLRRGYCFVHFASKDLAAKAKELDALEYNGRKLIVKRSRVRSRPALDKAVNSVVVANLPHSMSDNALKEAVSAKADEHGVVQSVSVERNEIYPAARAVVRLKTAGEAKSFLEAVNGSEQDGRTWLVYFNIEDRPFSSHPTRILRLDNLPKDIPISKLRDDLHDTCSSYGEVLTCRVRAKIGDSRFGEKTARVLFNNKVAATEAKRAADNENFELHGAKLTANFELEPTYELGADSSSQGSAF